MKVTKIQLRRIIREEKRKVLAENRVRRTVRRALREQTQTIDDWFERRSRMDAKDDILSMVSEDEVIEAGWAGYEEAYSHTDDGWEIFDRLSGEVQQRVADDLGFTVPPPAATETDPRADCHLDSILTATDEERKAMFGCRKNREAMYAAGVEGVDDPDKIARWKEVFPPYGVPPGYEKEHFDVEETQERWREEYEARWREILE
jgi:hypothetical protein